jgi:DNA modification methylase
VTAEQKELSRVTKEEWREYTKTVWHIANVVDPDHPAVFPAEIPRRLIKLFSLHGERVLDPFAGIGTTAAVALELDRSAVAVEQNADYLKRIRADCSQIESAGELQLIHGDARKLPVLDSHSIGLAITSPPYWNKADYGDKPTNLGNIASYRDFIDALQPAFDECYRVLAPGRKLCVVTANVNQHTDHGLLTFPLAADITMLLRKIGFVLINELIWSKDGTGGRWGSWGAQRPIFGSYPYPPNFLFKNVHEYIVIVAKPRRLRSKAKTALPYADLMGLGEDEHTEDIPPRKRASASRRSAEGRRSVASSPHEQGGHASILPA